jgi:hypothetical protein
MTTRNRLSAATLAAAMVALGGGAARANDGLPPAIQRVGEGPVARPPGAFQLSVDLRTALLRSAGYDPFSTNDVYTQTGVAGSWTLRTSPRLSTAVGATWESGTQSGQARGSDTSLSLRRLGAIVEERFAPRPWGYVFARLSPAWLHGSASLADLSIAAPLQTTFSTLAVDGSLGAAAGLSPRGSRVGFWAVADAGYGWAPDQQMTLAPALPAADRNKAGTTTLPDLAPRGAFMRFAFAVSF